MSAKRGDEDGRPVTSLPPLISNVRRLWPEYDPSVPATLILTLRLAALATQFHESVVRRHDLDGSSVKVLGALWLSGPPYQLSQAQLNDQVVQSPSGVSRTLKRLIGERLVRRTADDLDGRVSHIQLTAKGQKAVERVLADVIGRFAENAGEVRPKTLMSIAEAQLELIHLLEPLRWPERAEEDHLRYP